MWLEKVSRERVIVRGDPCDIIPLTDTSGKTSLETKNGHANNMNNATSSGRMITCGDVQYAQYSTYCKVGLTGELYRHLPTKMRLGMALSAVSAAAASVNNQAASRLWPIPTSLSCSDDTQSLGRSGVIFDYVGESEIVRAVICG